MNLKDVTILERQDIESLISMPEAIEAMRLAFPAISSGFAVVPVRTNLEIAEFEANSLNMPVFVPGYPFYLVKTVSINRRNPDSGLPLIHAVIQVFDASTGEMAALLDGEYITGLRTGAASALATDLLAPKDASVLAIFGTGPQAWYQVWGQMQVRRIQKVFVFGLGQERVASFANHVTGHFQVEAEPGEIRALHQVDIICTATTSALPLFERKHLRDTVHINGVGSFKPNMIEVAGDVIRGCLVAVDSRETSLVEAGDFIQAIEKGEIDPGHCRTELGELLEAKSIPDHSMSFFKSVGSAVQDFYCVAHLWPAIAGGNR